jgi:hypothetical protein
MSPIRTIAAGHAVAGDARQRRRRQCPHLWHDYRDKRNEYEALRRDSYADEPAPSWSTLWANDNALLHLPPFRQCFRTKA